MEVDEGADGLLGLGYPPAVELFGTGVWGGVEGGVGGCGGDPEFFVGEVVGGGGGLQLVGGVVHQPGLHDVEQGEGGEVNEEGCDRHSLE